MCRRRARTPHGRNNFDFCDGSVEGVNRIARGKLEEGVTTLLPTTLTLPEEELRKSLKAVAQYDGKGCKLPGVHLEGPFINVKCSGAQNPAYVRKPDIEEVKRLNAVYPVKKVSFAVETEGAAELTAELLRMGIVPSCVHSAAKYSEFHGCFRQGLRNLSHFCNQMTPLHHRDIGLVGAGFLEDDVFLELICDKLHICPDMAKINAPVPPIDPETTSSFRHGFFSLSASMICRRSATADSFIQAFPRRFGERIETFLSSRKRVQTSAMSGRVRSWSPVLPCP